MMKQTYITVMDYNTNEVSTYIIDGGVTDGEKWITDNTDHQPDEIHWMISDFMPEIRVIPVD